MAYRTTLQADDDIIAVYVRGYQEFGLTQAERYHAGLIAAFELIAANPRMARERRELDPSVRLHPYQSHLIVYLIDREGVLIVRVLQGRRDWEQLL
ncbi:type II toxin-antitoxin system RelE/ParE family toxin [Sabulicella rubraurantiaca]|uniref:type II toxin-antitoxin system RelE/ParE family toxin n=1 Tax=Sabulicella rubraurantiaca TaxID=2811429 RepID=UPI001A9736FE|nr:type II toxin-antitoxin system RelE/ParE family toxin [Sabulicella rubraurantiaca]